MTATFLFEIEVIRISQLPFIAAINLLWWWKQLGFIFLFSGSKVITYFLFGGSRKNPYFLFGGIRIISYFCLVETE